MSRQKGSKTAQKKNSLLSKNPESLSSQSKSSTQSSKTARLTDHEELLTNEVELMLSELKRTDDVQENVNVLEQMKKLITTTTGFESLPKTLKILLGHYAELKALYEQKGSAEVKKRLASLISFVATAQPPNSKGDVLRYYLLSDTDAVNLWGIAYVRDLNKDVLEQWKEPSNSSSKDTLVSLVARIARFYLQENSEVDAVDLLLETDQLTELTSLVTADDVCSKVCRYIYSSAQYLPDPEDKSALYAAINLWLKFGHCVEALIAAIHLQNAAAIEKIFCLAADEMVHKQMVLILRRHNLSINSEVIKPSAAKLLTANFTSKHFHRVTKQLDFTAPKGPADFVKPPRANPRHRSLSLLLSQQEGKSAVGDSLLSGFVNAAFGSDKLLLEGKDGTKEQSWIQKQENSAKITAVGSIGLLNLWDAANCRGNIEKYLHSTDTHLQSGALIACGLANCTTKSEATDQPLQLLKSQLEGTFSGEVQLGAIFGIGLAYVGSQHQQANGTLLEILQNDKTSPMNVGLCAQSCGLINHSSADGTVIGALLETLAVRFNELNSKAACSIVHSIGLLTMGKVEMLPTLLEAIQVVPNEQLRKYLKLVVEVFAHTGSSNLLKVQQLLEICRQVYEKQKKAKRSASAKMAKSKSKSRSRKTARVKKQVQKVVVTDTSLCDSLSMVMAVLGIGLISLRDDLNASLLMREFGHFLQAGNDKLTSATLMSIALLHLSNPLPSVIELLSKHTHSGSTAVSCTALLALGLIGAGTNNSQVGKVLGEAVIYTVNYTQGHFITVAAKVAQGLLHLGKGTLTLSPLMEGRLLRHTSLAGVLSLMLPLLQNELSVFGQLNYCFFNLACAIQPRMLVSLDCHSLEPISVSVRVGQPVDTVAQAGKPRTVTGFQTYNTPVLLTANEVAEMATEEFLPLTPYLEGFVLVKRKPVEGQQQQQKSTAANLPAPKANPSSTSK